MVLVGGKIQQGAIELEGRHLIADDFLGLWNGFPDGPSEGLQNPLNILRERSDVFVYTSETPLDHSLHTLIEPVARYRLLSKSVAESVKPLSRTALPTYMTDPKIIEFVTREKIASEVMERVESFERLST